jgi:hypothetical protein
MYVIITESHELLPGTLQRCRIRRINRIEVLDERANKNGRWNPSGVVT